MAHCQEKSKSDTKAKYRKHFSKSNQSCLSKWYRKESNQHRQMTMEQFPGDSRLFRSCFPTNQRSCGRIILSESKHKTFWKLSHSGAASPVSYK